jgi:hypothetical protein
VKIPPTFPCRAATAFAVLAVLLVWSLIQAGEPAPERFRSQFLQLCDLTSVRLQAGSGKDPFFVDSYAVRALCVAYDMTGKQAYLEACRAWAARMLALQEKMVPRGAYYMNYGRKPGEANGAWYVADSSSIAMGVLATAVRCKGAEKRRLLNSTEAFARLVMESYVGPGGGIRNGLWPRFDGEWWCCSGIFGSLGYLLYDETGEKRYLRAAEGALDWLNAMDPEKVQPYPLSEMGPTLPMYVLEAYSAGLSRFTPGSARREAAVRRIAWYTEWIARQQSKPPLERQWQATVRWGMKFGGLPFHQYVYSRALPGCDQLAAAADRELSNLASVVFAKEPELTQLPIFMMMSYAERLSPGTVYHCSKRRPAPGTGH